MEDYKNFKVGMKVIILNAPSLWSSKLNKNSPIDHPKTNFSSSTINYPYHCTIQKICDSEMTCGYFGWALDILVRDNLIILDIKEIRKDKLKKINHANR
jgi:hypothetical protein